MNITLLHASAVNASFARIANADDPRVLVLLAGHVHVAAGLHHEAGEALVDEELGALVDGVALRDAAERDRHALLLEEDGVLALVERDVLPADQREALLDVGGVG